MAKLQFLVPITVIGIASTATLATPEAFDAQLVLRSSSLSDGSYAFMEVTGPQLLQPGASVQIQPLDPAWGAVVNVSYAVETVGLSRTVTIDYESVDGSPLITHSATALLPTNDLYSLLFPVAIDDSDWDQDKNTRSWHNVLYGDALKIRDSGPRYTDWDILVPYYLGYDTQQDPANPGAFALPQDQSGARDVVPDRYTTTISYNIIPEPASLLLALCVLMIRACRN